jgi:hypothetical protein
MSGSEFERAYVTSKMQTLDWYSYIGETNGGVYMLRKRMPLIGSKPKERVFFTETNGLKQGFLQQMRNEATVEQGATGNLRPAGQ